MEKINKPNPKPKKQTQQHRKQNGLIAKENRDQPTTWMSKDEGKNSQVINFPSHFKRYVMKEKKIVVKKLIRKDPRESQSYDSPNKSKSVDLIKEGKDSKLIFIF